MTYTYPTIQNTVNNSIFLITSAMVGYDEFVIRYRTPNGLLKSMSLTRAEIDEKIKTGDIQKDRKQNVANYQEFLRIPIC